MKIRRMLAAAAAIGLAGAAHEARAGEHPGTAAEHPGTSAEHPGSSAGNKEGSAAAGTAMKTKAFSAKEIKAAMIAEINADEAKMGGVCTIRDDKEAKDWTLKFVKLHDPVRVIDGKTAFACADFVEMAGGKKTNNKLDLDFWLEPDATGKLQVVATKIHKVNGTPRYTYEKNKLVEVKSGKTAELCVPAAESGGTSPVKHEGSGM